MEHVSQAVVAELDGALCNMQLLFGVNTVARAEFQRIQQELTHWRPLVEVRPSAAVSPPCVSKGQQPPGYAPQSHDQLVTFSTLEVRPFSALNSPQQSAKDRKFQVLAVPSQ